MSKLAKVLSEAFAGRNLAKDAGELGLAKSDMTLLLSGSYELSPMLAVKIGSLTGADPKKILNAQTDDQLQHLGVKASRARAPVVDSAESQARSIKAAKLADGEVAGKTPAFSVKRDVRSMAI